MSPKTHDLVALRAQLTRVSRRFNWAPTQAQWRAAGMRVAPTVAMVNGGYRISGGKKRPKGSWATAMTRLNLAVVAGGQPAYSVVQCKAAITRVARAVYGTTTRLPSERQYELHRQPGDPGSKVLRRRLGGGTWTGIAHTMGMLPVRPLHRNPRHLTSDLRSLARRLHLPPGRAPSRRAWERAGHSAQHAVTLFGTWGAFCQQAGFQPNRMRGHA